MLEQRERFGVFDVLRNCFHAGFAADLGDESDEFLVDRAVDQVDDEGGVDLDVVKRRFLNVAQRPAVGAEIVVKFLACPVFPLKDRRCVS